MLELPTIWTLFELQSILRKNRFSVSRCQSEILFRFDTSTYETDLRLSSRNASNSSGVPAQLTIFFAGTVDVYHDISPEVPSAYSCLKDLSLT
ncbi:hypothetical protein ABKV19_004013 [Rosa sericea]